MNSLRKKTWKCVLAALFFVLLVSGVNIQPVQAAVKLSDSSVNLCVGDTMKLALSGTSKKAAWKSSKSSVVKVSSKGSIRAVSKGNATITATVNKKSYKCKVKVNKTFKVDETSVSIKKNTGVTAFLSVNGSINASVADKKICSVTFGKWDGDYMPLVIVPKKVGSTTVTFTNSANDESCELKVKVTALPVNATFQTPAVDDGANSFIVGENTMSFAFQLDRDAKTTNFKIYDANGNVVRVISVGALGAKKWTTVVWDGLDDNGSPVNGAFKYAVVADGTKTTGGSSKVLAASPFGKGDGTEENPFLVSDLEELKLVKSYNGSYFAQDADIDFNYSSISALFDDTAPFVGTYNGKYGDAAYRMINFYGYNSVFGSIGAEGALKNVSMSNCVLNTTGSLLAYTNSGTIDGCTVSGNILCNAGNQAAMLVMYNKGQIRDCSVSGNLNVVASNVIAPTALKAGSIAMSNTGIIAQCTSSVAISQQMQIGTYIATSAYEIYTGGIVAENAAGAFVTQCTFIGGIDASITLPETLENVEGLVPGNIYSGYVAGSSQGYISSCINAGINGSLRVQGSGTGMVQ